MHVFAEIVPGRRSEAVDLPANSTGLDLLRVLRMTPDAHILVRQDVPVAADEVLSEGDRIQVIGVVSGGSSP